MTTYTKCSLDTPRYILKSYSYICEVYYHEGRSTWAVTPCYTLLNVSEEDLCALELQGHILQRNSQPTTPY